MKETIFEQGYKAEVEITEPIKWFTLMPDYNMNRYIVKLNSKILKCKSELCNNNEAQTIKEMYKSFFKTAAENKIAEITIKMMTNGRTL